MEKIWLKTSATILAVVLIGFLVRMFPLTYTFPLQFVDYSSHIARLHFINTYGLFNEAPNWWGGFKPLLLEPPLHPLLSLLLLKVVGLLPAVYLSLIILLLVALVLMWKLGGEDGLIHYCFFFAFPLSIIWFVIYGRLPELSAWVCLATLFYLLIHYYNKHLNLTFVLCFLPTYILIILSHYTAWIFSTILLIPFITNHLNTKNRDTTIILLSLLIAFTLTAWWWLPFIATTLTVPAVDTIYGTPMHLLDWSYTSSQLMAILTPSLFLLLLFSKWCNKESITFYLPAAVLGVGIMFRVVCFLPLLNKLKPESYTLFFIFLGSYLFIKMSDRIKIDGSLLLLMTMITILIGSAYISNLNYSFAYDELHMKLITQMEGITTPLVIEKADTSNGITFTYENNVTHLLVGGKYQNNTLYAGSLYAYGAVYFNTTTPYGRFLPTK